MATVTRTPPLVERIPPLENGDCLTAAEFLRRYEAMPGIKAELIEGIVYMASPVTDDHAQPHADMMFWLGCYRMGSPGVVSSDNGTVRLNLKNLPQPDGHLRILPECGGRTHLGDDRLVVGGPELVFEVARSSASYDLGAKLNAYLRNEIPEYVVWRVDDGEIDWFFLKEGRYERLKPDADGVFKSIIFPGLRLDAAAMIRGDLTTIHRVVQEGIAGPEHAAFVAKLRENAAKIPPPMPEGRRP